MERDRRFGMGNGGWVRVEDPELPGDLFLRFARDATDRWRVIDLYLQGDWRQIVAADLRGLDLGAIEQWVSPWLSTFELRTNAPGPDLRTLISTFAESFGSGSYDGRHCEHCDAPLRGTEARGRERWTSDWTALSWFAQLKDTRIPRPKVRMKRRVEEADRATVPPLQRHEGRYTDEWFAHLANAYNEALRRGLAPAPELARQVGDCSPRTIHKWLGEARKRGFLPPASSRGKAR